MPKLKQTSLPHGKPKNRTAAEAARLGISKDKLSKLVKLGIIPVIKLGHSTHLFDPETTDAALLRHGAQLWQGGRITQPLQWLLFKAQLRCYRVCVRRVVGTVEFIGYRAARDEDVNRDPDASRNDRPPLLKNRSHNLYEDIIGGFLHYSLGCEEKVDTSAVRVEITCDRWCCGKNLEEILAQFRDRYGPDIEIPSLLESPPEVEEMHRVTGYDS